MEKEKLEVILLLMKSYSPSSYSIDGSANQRCAAFLKVNHDYFVAMLGKDGDIVRMLEFALDEKDYKLAETLWSKVTSRLSEKYSLNNLKN